MPVSIFDTGIFFLVKSIYINHYWMLTYLNKILVFTTIIELP